VNGVLAAPRQVTFLPPARRFDWNNLGVRVLSAVVLIPAVLAVVWRGGPLFLVMVAIALALLSLEWGSMSAPRSPTRVVLVVATAVLASVFTLYSGHIAAAWLIAALGALVAAVVARGVSDRPSDAALGVIYIGIPALCLVWLHRTNQGPYWTLMLLAITWAADIGAYAVGNVLKGPKLWPRFSPNETWSGFYGGLGAAMLTGMLVATLPLFQLNLAAAAVIGVAGGLATMAGDLWESVLKRRFGVKDSGDLIPGHGGLLDRVDGLMFAVVVIAAARLVNYLGWSH
jgi:phosphatidate cytidylyltransferase